MQSEGSALAHKQPDVSAQRAASPSMRLNKMQDSRLVPCFQVHSILGTCQSKGRKFKLLSFPDAMQVAEVMAKVGEQVRNAEDEAERRSGVLGALEDIASMRAECAWLASYEKDDARFKVSFISSFCQQTLCHSWCYASTCLVSNLSGLQPPSYHATLKSAVAQQGCITLPAPCFVTSFMSVVVYMHTHSPKAVALAR